MRKSSLSVSPHESFLFRCLVLLLLLYYFFQAGLCVCLYAVVWHIRVSPLKAVDTE